MQSEGRPLNQALMIETAKREWKYFKIYESFRPNLKVMPIAPKFYASHQQFDESLVNEEYVDLLKRVYAKMPNQRYEQPATENQCYGWYVEPLIDNGRDFRLDFRSAVSPDIKLACEMMRMTRQMRSVATDAKAK